MIVQYGNYSHADNEVSVAISKPPWRDTDNLRIGYTERWELSGTIFGDGTVADLTAKIAALEAAYASDGGNIYLKDGSTNTAHYLLSAACVGGVRVVDIGYPDGQGAEYATHRKFRIVLEGSVRSSSTDLLAYSETLTFQGSGLGEFVVRQPLEGMPIVQVVNQATPVRLTQSGRAIGYSAYPAVPSPYFPGNEHAEQRSILYALPKYSNAQYTEYEVSWTYLFEFAQHPGAQYPVGRR